MSSLRGMDKEYAQKELYRINKPRICERTNKVTPEKFTITSGHAFVAYDALDDNEKEFWGVDSAIQHMQIYESYLVAIIGE